MNNPFELGNRVPGRADVDLLDWERLAVPQSDAYDTTVFHSLLGQSAKWRGEPVPVGGCHAGDPGTEGRGPRIAYCYESVPGLENAALDHGCIAQALGYLDVWPEAARQFRSLMVVLHPMMDPAWPCGEEAFLVGSKCHSSEHQLGTMWSTINCPVMLAENFVHELAHQKLFALGVQKESAECLILNDSTELYNSSVILDRKRPMTAVFHGLYAFAHVAELELRVFKELGAPTSRYAHQAVRMKGRVAQNQRRLTMGISEVRTFARFDEAGTRFFQAFAGWLDQLIATATAYTPASVSDSSDSKSQRLSGRGGVSQGRPRRVPGCTVSRTWDLVSVSIPGAKSSLLLNHSASEIFALCDGSRTVDEIECAIAARFGFGAGALSAEVISTIQQLGDMGAVAWTSPVKT